MHDVLNIKFLKRTPGTRSVSRPGPIVDQGSDIFVMERILGFKKIRGVDHYLVKWKDYPEYESTYEPIQNFTSTEAKRVLADYRLEMAKSQHAKDTKKKSSSSSSKS